MQHVSTSGTVGLMDANRKRSIERLVLAADAMVVLASMAVAVAVHGALRAHIPVLKAPPAFERYVLLAYVTLPLAVGLVPPFGLHRILERPLGAWRLFVTLSKHHAALLVGVSLVLFLTQEVVNRTLVGLFLATNFALMYGERRALVRWARYQHVRGHGQTRLLLVGTPSPAMDTLVRRANEAPLGPRFVGLVTTEPTERTDVTVGALTLPVLGALDGLDKTLHEHPVDRVLFFAPVDAPARATSALAACETIGVPASFAVDLDALGVSSAHIGKLHGTSFIHVDRAPKSEGGLALKQLVDTSVAGIAIVLLAPAFVLIAIAIALTMGRPVLFAQERAGLRGRVFTMFKFRTMIQDAEALQSALANRNEMSGPTFKMTADPRVTRLGAFLRRTSLDELPQLFNVLLGTMSLVGPRPLPVNEQQQIVGWHRRRLSVKPGITCFWQIGGRSDVSFDDWMKLDLRYVDEWSLALDLRILAATIPAVLRGRGAR
jgi:exopolysaccharide biosynthesis polyprenyl glycosylphosphotransferase